ARRLYISPKTAAVHVSNILMKLGMSSRTEVAAWAVRSGLAGPHDLQSAASGSAVRRRAAGEPIAERSGEEAAEAKRRRPAWPCVAGPMENRLSSGASRRPPKRSGGGRRKRSRVEVVMWLTGATRERRWSS